MKLRPYTPEETDDLINKFKVVSDYCYSINASAHVMLLDKFYEYIRNFKKSLFTWKALEEKDFIDRLTCYNHPRIISIDGSDGSSLFENDLFSKEGDFVYGFGYFNTIDISILERYGIEKFNKDEMDILNKASTLTDDFYLNYDLREKYTVLIKYAHRPFEFDESDIKWLERIDYFYNKALEWNSN